MSQEGEITPRTESLDPLETSAPSLAPGQLVLGRYRVERSIGRGGMGEVYEATHVTLGSRVALKLPLGRFASGRSAARLLREAQVAASLDPEHVVRVLDVGVSDDGRPVLVLERLEGETVAERADGRRLGVTEAVDLVLGASVGLAEAHARAVVHRDVKPSNLFVARRRDGSTVVKVLDFGVAALRAGADEDDARLTDSRAPVGSPPYMAPEQVRGRAVDPRTDVWGLGVTLFELLAGRLPFDGPSPSAFAAAIVADTPRALGAERPEVPAALAELVGRCLEKDPAARPASAAELAASLAPFASPAARDQARSLLGEAPSELAASAGPTSRARRGGVVALGVGVAAILAWAATRPAERAEAAGGTEGPRRPGSGDALGGAGAPPLRSGVPAPAAPSPAAPTSEPRAVEPAPLPDPAERPRAPERGPAGARKPAASASAAPSAAAPPPKRPLLDERTF